MEVCVGGDSISTGVDDGIFHDDGGIVSDVSVDTDTDDVAEDERKTTDTRRSVHDDTSSEDTARGSCDSEVSSLRSERASSSDSILDVVDNDSCGVEENSENCARDFDHKSLDISVVNFNVSCDNGSTVNGSSHKNSVEKIETGEILNDSELRNEVKNLNKPDEDLIVNNCSGNTDNGNVDNGSSDLACKELDNVDTNSVDFGVSVLNGFISCDSAKKVSNSNCSKMCDAVEPLPQSGLKSEYNESSLTRDQSLGLNKHTGLSDPVDSDHLVRVDQPVNFDQSIKTVKTAPLQIRPDAIMIETIANNVESTVDTSDSEISNVVSKQLNDVTISENNLSKDTGVDTKIEIAEDCRSSEDLLQDTVCSNSDEKGSADISTTSRVNNSACESLTVKLDSEPRLFDNAPQNTSDINCTSIQGITGHNRVPCETECSEDKLGCSSQPLAELQDCNQDLFKNFVVNNDCEAKVGGNVDVGAQGAVVSNSNIDKDSIDNKTVEENKTDVDNNVRLNLLLQDTLQSKHSKQEDCVLSEDILGVGGVQSEGNVRDALSDTNSEAAEEPITCDSLQHLTYAQIVKYSIKSPEQTDKVDKSTESEKTEATNDNTISDALIISVSNWSDHSDCINSLEDDSRPPAATFEPYLAVTFVNDRLTDVTLDSFAANLNEPVYTHSAALLQTTVGDDANQMSSLHGEYVRVSSEEVHAAMQKDSCNASSAANDCPVKNGSSYADVLKTSIKREPTTESCSNKDGSKQSSRKGEGKKRHGDRDSGDLEIVCDDPVKLSSRDSSAIERLIGECLNSIEAPALDPPDPTCKLTPVPLILEDQTTADPVDDDFTFVDIEQSLPFCSDESRNLVPLRRSSNTNAVKRTSALLSDKDDATRAQRRSALKSVRVSFPPEENMVSGCVYPETPWKDAKSCTVDELTEAYKTSCIKHSVKPMPCILTQLQKIISFEERQDCLSIKGECLSSVQCDAIEEILKRVQYRTVDVESCKLTEEVAVVLFEMLEFYESCLKLNISCNANIGIRGWMAGARMIKKMGCLEVLEARQCSVPDQVITQLSKALQIADRLHTINLENSIRSGRHVIQIVAALKQNHTVQELYLAGNSLESSDATHLSGLLSTNQTLEVLDLRNNKLQDVGFGRICQGLLEQRRFTNGLSTLVMWNNHLTHESMSALATVLVSTNSFNTTPMHSMNTKSLQTVNLGHNNLTNEGVHKLKEGLMKNQTLLRFGLQATQMSCEGAIALAEYIAESPKLLRLDLRANGIKTAGLMALSLSLKVNYTLTAIELDLDPKKDSSMKDCINQQRRLLCDIANYMMRNNRHHSSPVHKDSASDSSNEAAKSDETLRNPAQEQKTSDIVERSSGDTKFSDKMAELADAVNIVNANSASNETAGHSSRMECDYSRDVSSLLRDLRQSVIGEREEIVRDEDGAIISSTVRVRSFQDLLPKNLRVQTLDSPAYVPSLLLGEFAAVSNSAGISAACGLGTASPAAASPLAVSSAASTATSEAVQLGSANALVNTSSREEKPISVNLSNQSTGNSSIVAPAVTTNSAAATVAKPAKKKFTISKAVIKTSSAPVLLSTDKPANNVTSDTPVANSTSQSSVVSTTTTATVKSSQSGTSSSPNLISTSFTTGSQGKGTGPIQLGGSGPAPSGGSGPLQPEGVDPKEPSQAQENKQPCKNQLDTSNNGLDNNVKPLIENHASNECSGEKLAHDKLTREDDGSECRSSKGLSSCNEVKNEACHSDTNSMSGLDDLPPSLRNLFIDNRPRRDSIDSKTCVDSVDYKCDNNMVSADRVNNVDRKDNVDNSVVNKSTGDNLDNRPSVDNRDDCASCSPDNSIDKKDSIDNVCKADRADTKRISWSVDGSDFDVGSGETTLNCDILDEVFTAEQEFPAQEIPMEKILAQKIPAQEILEQGSVSEDVLPVCNDLLSDNGIGDDLTDNGVTLPDCDRSVQDTSRQENAETVKDVTNSKTTADNTNTMKSKCADVLDRLADSTCTINNIHVSTNNSTCKIKSDSTLDNASSTDSTSTTVRNKCDSTSMKNSTEGTSTDVLSTQVLSTSCTDTHAISTACDRKEWIRLIRKNRETFDFSDIDTDTPVQDPVYSNTVLSNAAQSNNTSDNSGLGAGLQNEASSNGTT